MKREFSLQLKVCLLSPCKKQRSSLETQSQSTKACFELYMIENKSMYNQSGHTCNVTQSAMYHCIQMYYTQHPSSLAPTSYRITALTTACQYMSGIYQLLVYPGLYHHACVFEVNYNYRELCMTVTQLQCPFLVRDRTGATCR